jgi:putative (di)nucleoside polyphosphate hydrolase
MLDADVPCIPKVCAYITRNDRELLTFESDRYDGLQIPKGTIEPGETPPEALGREVEEESGLTGLQSVRRLTTDVWVRRLSPPKLYQRHFFHATVDDNRDEWTHIVTGEGEERGKAFEYTWRELPADHEFALGLDDHLHLVEPIPVQP